MSRSKIVLYGHFGTGNIGNDSTLQAALSNIEGLLPEARIVCVCSGPERISERFGIEARLIDPLPDGPQPKYAWIPSWRIRRSVEELTSLYAQSVWFRDTSMFIVVGTGAVDDSAVHSPWDAPYDLFKWCLAAKLGGARVVFLSVGVGPIQNPMSRRLMLGALRLADRRSYRESAAVKYLGRHGFDTRKDSLYPDLVFSMDVGRWEGEGWTTASPMRIGLGLIYYLGWRHDPKEGGQIFRDYMEKIKSFLKWLLERGHTVRLLVGDHVDYRCVDEIHDFMQTPALCAYRDQVIAEEITSVEALLEQISQTDVVIASRFHNVLCALMMKRPVISIGYHEKNDLLMAEFGMSDYCQFIETLDVEQLKKQFEDSLAHHALLTEGISERLSERRLLLATQYSELVVMHKAVL